MVTRNKMHVRVERRFDAPQERVFNAWLDPAILERWMFGRARGDETICQLTVDGQVGRSFSFLVCRNGKEITYTGRYLHLNRPSRLVFTWGIAGLTEDQSRVIVDVLPVGTGCELTLTHECPPQWTDDAARTEYLWTARLNALASTLGDTGL